MEQKLGAAYARARCTVMEILIKYFDTTCARRDLPNDATINIEQHTPVGVLLLNLQLSLIVFLQAQTNESAFMLGRHNSTVTQFASYVIRITMRFVETEICITHFFVGNVNCSPNFLICQGLFKNSEVVICI